MQNDVTNKVPNKEAHGKAEKGRAFIYMMSRTKTVRWNCTRGFRTIGERAA